MAVINPPPSASNPDETLGGGWAEFFSKAYAVLFALTQSGTTAQRPTKMLWAGRMYFDISLGANGKPIWVNKAGTGWVLADGTTA